MNDPVAYACKYYYRKKNKRSDDFGLRNPVIQNIFSPKRDTSALARGLFCRVMGTQLKEKIAPHSPPMPDIRASRT